MIVLKYLNWVVVIIWQDGYVYFFDGVKDMFKFLYDLFKYVFGYCKQDIVGIYVIDFYNLVCMDVCWVFYVIGFDVFGLMGYEFVLFVNQVDVDDFLKDYKGKWILFFDQVMLGFFVILDVGKF